MIKFCFLFNVHAVFSLQILTATLTPSISLLFSHSEVSLSFLTVSSFPFLPKFYIAVKKYAADDHHNNDEDDGEDDDDDDDVEEDDDDVGDDDSDGDAAIAAVAATMEKSDDDYNGHYRDKKGSILGTPRMTGNEEEVRRSRIIVFTSRQP